MSKSYFMTVGYPGGEYIARSLEELRQYEDAETPSTVRVAIRPCPPDLAEWLDAGPLWKETATRCKVPGGWQTCIEVTDKRDPQLYELKAIATCYIPVRGADGITILEVQHG